MSEPIILCKILCGSNLYGLDTPESDKDYKGVFLPIVKDLMLDKAPQHISKNTNNTDKRNTKDDIDFEMFSLQRFLHLVSEGEPIAVEMLFAPDNMIIETSDIWKEVVKVRHQLLTKTIRAFVGYCKGQASKYCMKGERLSSLEFCLKSLKRFDTKFELPWFTYLVEEMRGMKYFETFEIEGNHGRSFSILKKKFYETAKIETVMQSLEHTINKYGDRTKVTQEMGGKDWKSLSHAIRIAIEVREILGSGTLTLPLVGESRDYALNVKLGKFSLDHVENRLNMLLEDVNNFQETSTLPEKFNRDLADKLILDAYNYKNINNNFIRTITP